MWGWYHEPTKERKRAYVVIANRQDSDNTTQGDCRPHDLTGIKAGPGKGRNVVGLGITY